MNAQNTPANVTLVSGLPRSGTSMMMSMLQAGGMDLVVDGERTADEDNPKGYFELERIKKIKSDADWLLDADGKVIKAISQLLLDLPTDGSIRYKIIFMRRNIDEVLASQKKMLIRRGTYKPEISDDEMKRMFLLHLEQVTDFLQKHDVMETLYVNYNRLISDPSDRIDSINQFLGGGLDTAAMAAVVDKQLYRNRA
ncbi:MAG TPA: sulfotransferase domain-containing protein [Phycisphaerae bacterium]|nr:sulfotransferase domain-containing protein [Phycisphaerales bacterium]HNO78506.1 sulfotransferase domain-containing protein [Phycisphaerae bacterium]